MKSNLCIGMLAGAGIGLLSLCVGAQGVPVCQDLHTGPGVRSFHYNEARSQPAGFADKCKDPFLVNTACYETNHPGNPCSEWHYSGKCTVGDPGASSFGERKQYRGTSTFNCRESETFTCIIPWVAWDGTR